jgi:hypothetical protein
MKVKLNIFLLELFWKHSRVLSSIKSVSRFGKVPYDDSHDYAVPIDNINNFSKELLEQFLDYLLKNGYCDSDVYEEGSVIDKFLDVRLR